MNQLEIIANRIMRGLNEFCKEAGAECDAKYVRDLYTLLDKIIDDGKARRSPEKTST